MQSFAGVSRVARRGPRPLGAAIAGGGADGDERRAWLPWGGALLRRNLVPLGLIGSGFCFRIFRRPTFKVRRCVPNVVLLVLEHWMKIDGCEFPDDLLYDPDRLGLAR